MKIQKLIPLLGIVLVLVGCSREAKVRPSSDLPSQEITASAPAGSYKVVFLNTAGILHRMDSTDLLRISVNGKYYGQIGSYEYMQLFLNKGTYTVSLVHYDVGEFKSEHNLKVSGNMFVDSSPTIFSNELEVLDSEPKDFKSEFKAAYWE
ncbi:hypothetical protein [Thiomicrorhabdus sp.]|uniref:hypothetical protein n=1 Tax=Thiomicrorhabdus sp. TaxID=2039724 RepID=UPI0029C6E740|nr:hypothetical protein [Thiomicrorhabdus sp.]